MASSHTRDFSSNAERRGGSSRVLREELHAGKSSRTLRQDLGSKSSRALKDDFGSVSSRALKEDYGGSKSSKVLRDELGSRSSRQLQHDSGIRSSRALREEYGIRSARPTRQDYESSDWGTRWLDTADRERRAGKGREAAQEVPEAKPSSRSERKRMWRKNLSADKLSKLRERDALRKRMERQNMSAEKRRDVRTKDTARKAALRRERRMNERGVVQGEGISLPLEVDEDDRMEGEDYSGKLDAKFRKISVESLLN